MIAALLAEFGGWIAAAIVALAGGVGVYLQGRATGRQRERIAHEVKIIEQAEQARKEVRDVERKNAGRSDDAVIDAARNWVRK